MKLRNGKTTGTTPNKGVRIDFSKMKPKPASPPIVFQPTPEEKIRNLESYIKKLENENASLHKMHDDLVANEYVMSEILEDKIDEINKLKKENKKLSSKVWNMRI